MFFFIIILINEAACAIFDGSQLMPSSNTFIVHAQTKK